MSDEFSEAQRIVGSVGDGMDIEDDLGDTSSRERIHARNVEHLERFARARTVHLQAEPRCDAAPLCSGAPVLLSLAFRGKMWPDYMQGLLLSAIALIETKNGEIADLRAKLMGMDADLVDALGELGDTQTELGVALARLAACDDLLGDATPPVLPVDEP